MPKLTRKDLPPFSWTISWELNVRSSDHWTDPVGADANVTGDGGANEPASDRLSGGVRAGGDKWWIDEGLGVWEVRGSCRVKRGQTGPTCHRASKDSLKNIRHTWASIAGRYDLLYGRELLCWEAWGIIPISQHSHSCQPQPHSCLICKLVLDLAIEVPGCELKFDWASACNVQNWEWGYPRRTKLFNDQKVSTSSQWSMEGTTDSCFSIQISSSGNRQLGSWQSFSYIQPTMDNNSADRSGSHIGSWPNRTTRLLTNPTQNKAVPHRYLSSSFHRSMASTTQWCFSI
jgi:hypothetical protein